jgi:cytochrome o ubiquinol oxidase subunit 3
MSAVAAAESDPHASHGLDDAGAGWRGPASKRVVTGYGFWIFILSDMIMFAAFFATYAVLHGQTAGGPAGHETVRPPQCRDRDRSAARVEL